jgi:ribosomal protein L40E
VLFWIVVFTVKVGLLLSICMRCEVTNSWVALYCCGSRPVTRPM